MSSTRTSHAAPDRSSYLGRLGTKLSGEPAALRPVRPDQLLGRAPLGPVPDDYVGPYADADPRVHALEAMMLDIGDDLPGDLDAIHCTTVAWWLREQFANVRIYGVTEEEQPDAQVHRGSWGHDFAIAKYRYIVDPWAVHFADTDIRAKKYVHDLQDPRDAGEIERLYGDRSLWLDANEFNSPQQRDYTDLDRADLEMLAQRGKPGAVAELESRGLSIPVVTLPSPARKSAGAVWSRSRR